LRTLISRVFALVVFSAALFAAAPGNAATYSGIVMDAKTGKVLYSHRGDARAFPASLTKMMTLYLLFEAMETGKVSKSTRIRISAGAAARPPSKLGIKPGGSVTAEQAILVLVTKSANDVAAAVAEHLSGSEAAFAIAMTRKAHQLGMRNTTFRNASGLPDPNQVTTARDMALLGIALREHFPQFYRYFSTRSFTYGRKRMANHNRLLGRVAGMDGIKTGYTRASGYNLVSSVRRGNRSIVAVVMGEPTGKARNARMHGIIAKYLPRASSGADQFLMAKSPAIPQARSENILTATKIPVPQPRSGVVAVANMASEAASTDWVASRERDRIVVAHEIGRREISQSSAVPIKPALVAAIEQKLRDMKIGKVPVPARGAGAIRQTGVVDPVRTAAVAEMETAPEPRQEEEIVRGWQVQIAAVPERNAARNILRAARDKLPKLLSGYSDYTEPVDKDGTTLYRARFAGFDSKAQARDACNQLKRQKVGCLALQN